ncbi:aspartate aminotransferase family protein [Kordiimonas marina]|uniref:aspartate aminotransferase family protein n=1 Tax=Kordiimonas marina TaxID=2872312 RepID=UPI001FF5FB27|nr:aspartate aminotransferase family protein [Kordiimonas marina]MCJ9430609.1 aspartate aminotransferase family protein [Kordiimonas marina]
MTSVFYRDMGKAYPVAVSASGMHIYDADGKAYLDMCGGAAVSCLGHQHPDVIRAVKAQLDQMAFAHTAFFSSRPQEQLAERLVARFGDPGARAYFTAGGSEANETALKLAWQYWKALGRPEKAKIISRDHSYHGNTFGTLSVSGNPARRRPMDGLLIEWPRIVPCYAYRHQEAGEGPEAYGLRAAGDLEDAIKAAGAETVAAFIVEPVVGASLGAVSASPGYFKKIREICDRYDILLIADEVMCGSGRTGSFFAFEQEGFRPDIVTLAKGIGGGYQPLAATIASSRIVEALQESPAGFSHGHTYIGHACACAAGLAVQEAFETYQLLEAVRTKGAQLQDALTERFSDHPNVGDIRGRGLFRAIEFVADKETKAPIENSAAVAGRIKATAMTHGLMVYPGGNNEEGGSSCHILLAPPYILEDEHIGMLISRLEAVIGEVFGD